MLMPMILVSVYTYQTGATTVREQAKRVLEFFMGDVELILSDVERVMDGYMLQTGGSCASEDLVLLRRYIATNKSLLAMGLIATDGQVACAIGESKFEKLNFPALKGKGAQNIEFSELRSAQGSSPIMIKTGSNATRIYAILSNESFTRILLPDFMIRYSQLDIILPNGGLWDSIAGDVIKFGLTTVTTFNNSSYLAGPL